MWQYAFSDITVKRHGSCQRHFREGSCAPWRDRIIPASLRRLTPVKTEALISVLRRDAHCADDDAWIQRRLIFSFLTTVLVRHKQIAGY